jgi:hypothetical protein
MVASLLIITLLALQHRAGIHGCFSPHNHLNGSTIQSWHSWLLLSSLSLKRLHRTELAFMVAFLLIIIWLHHTELEFIVASLLIITLLAPPHRAGIHNRFLFLSSSYKFHRLELVFTASIASITFPF